MESVDSLHDRCLKVYERMTSDPNRPFWVIEYLCLLSELAELHCLLDNKFAESLVSIDRLIQRVESLEVKYSELMYRISCK